MKYERLMVDKSGMEKGSRGRPDFPVAGGGSVNIANYESGRFECHFHRETELTLIESGEMYYRANDKVFLLHAGDAVFVNVNVMHAGWQKEGENCCYLPFNFATAMVSGHDNSLIEREYIQPMVENNILPFLVMRAGNPDDAVLLNRVRRIYDLKIGLSAGYELLLKAELCLFWHELYRIAAAKGEVTADRGEAAVKKAISFMEAHYAEYLTLSDIAGACGLSRSEFCRVFHRFTGRTPFSYLQHLRVRRSLRLLVDKKLSVTEIAERTGFSGGSYYAEVFRRFMGTSPLGYRKNL